jgi:hypothetical protein
MEEKVNIPDDIRRDIKIMAIENHVQTAAVVLLFIFGISTLSQLLKK